MLALAGCIAVIGVVRPQGALHGEAKYTRVRSMAAATEPVAGRSMLHVSLAGVGSCAPASRVTNVDLESVVDTSDEWITKRTGISSRHLLPPGDSLVSLASSAGSRALENAGVDASSIELVVLATSSPEDLFGDAAAVAASIGAEAAVAFDLTAACSGFLFGLVTASQFVHNGAYSNALVIGADALSRWVDWSDRNTCILFGDGAGAMVLKASEGSTGPGVLGFAMQSDGKGRPDLNLGYAGEERTLSEMAGAMVTPRAAVVFADLTGLKRSLSPGAVSKGAYRRLAMNGKEVYKFACSRVPEILLEALGNAGMTAEEVDWLLLHQANIRIMEAVASRLGIPMDKVGVDVSGSGRDPVLHPRLRSSRR